MKKSDVSRGPSRARKSGAAATKAKPAKAAPATKPAKASSAKLLAGGNPQIAKGEGDAPVQAYIAALPGWKRALGRRIDALVTTSVPHVRKAVKWNSPFYGIDGQGWFVVAHAYTSYIKVTFLRGASLRPLPPRSSKSGDARSIDLREGDALDEAQLASWFQQAAALPGWIP